MLCIYSKGYVDADLIEEKLPWRKYFKQYKITNYLDSSDIDIVENVENTSLINNETIRGKFSDMPIGIGNLSEGCKTLLSINHALKTDEYKNRIFDITSCGPNAIRYLATEMCKNKDVKVYCRHSHFGNATCDIKIDDEIKSRLLDASIEYSIKLGEYR